MKRLVLLFTTTATILLGAGVAFAVTTQTLTNTAPITIPEAGTASPYPSQISTSGNRGSVKDVDVILNGFSHAFPDDVNILLEGPQGQKALIMADAGGGCNVSGANIRIKDEARRALPDSKCLLSKSYKPRDYDAAACFGSDDDSFAAPAPAAPYASKLNVFDGTDPNGTWNLYVVDDCVGDGGQIAGGWSLVLTTG